MAYGFGVNESMSAYNENTPVESHTGDYRALLRRFEKKAARAVKQGHSGIAELGPHLLNWIADARNLRAAWDFLKRHGGTAPGPNGMTYDDLTNNEVWELMRALGQALRNGTYRSGPDRLVWKQKTNGKGYRALRLQNIEDRVVARAVVQIIQPLLDPKFNENSYGYRPGRDRCHALANAMRLTVEEDRLVWLTEDIRDAFDQVPQQRLLDIVRKSLPNAEGLWALIEQILKGGTKRGLRQGSPLSPLLLNLYLDHVLDRVWDKKYPDTPLLRSADDILISCRSEQEALNAQESLRRILVPAGMPLKESTESCHAIRNLHNDKADWLGYQISNGDNGLKVQIAETAWSALAEGLKLAHYKPAPPLRAIQIVKGWLGQLGPCFPHKDRDQVITRIIGMARQWSFYELPSEETLAETWRESHSRWQILRQSSLRAVQAASQSDYKDTDADGSADRHVFSAAKRRSDGVPSGAPSLCFSLDEMVTLHTDGSCDRFTQQGGWAAIFEAPSLPRTMRGSGMLHRSTNNRAELIAVIKGLELLSGPTWLRIFSDSKYVVRGIDELLPKWKSQGWRAGSGRHKRTLQNADLWRKLDILLQPHKVTCKWVKGHSGDHWNQECDRMARTRSMQETSWQKQAVVGSPLN